MTDVFAEARKSKTFMALRVLTESGWLSGMYLKPSNRRLADHLNQGHDSVVLTNAFVPGNESELDFLCVHRDKMVLVMPDDAESGRMPSGMFVQTTERQAVLLAGLASLSGTVEVPANIRVSDYFGRTKGFVSVRACVLTVRNPHGGEQWTRRVEQVLVNLAALVAVSEVEGG